MGAWSVDAFGNDDAVDWSYDLENSFDLSLIEAALEAVLASGKEYVELAEASTAIAAAEVIARLQGNGGERNAYTEAADAWVEKTKLKPPIALAQKARLAIDRILEDDSEIKELWEESDEFADWLICVADLKQRIAV